MLGAGLTHIVSSTLVMKYIISANSQELIHNTNWNATLTGHLQCGHHEIITHTIKLFGWYFLTTIEALAMEVTLISK